MKIGLKAIALLTVGMFNFGLASARESFNCPSTVRIAPGAPVVPEDVPAGYESLVSETLKDVHARVQQALRQFCEPEGGDLEVPARFTHRGIASMVGASRKMVTRVLGGLEQSGLVRVDGRRIALSASAIRGMPNQSAG